MNKKLIDKLNKYFEDELLGNRELENFILRILMDKNDNKKYILSLTYYRYKDINSSYVDYVSKSKNHLTYKHQFTIAFDEDADDLEFRLMRIYRQFDKFAIMRDRLNDNKRENKLILLTLKNKNEVKEIPGIILSEKANHLQREKPN